MQYKVSHSVTFKAKDEKEARRWYRELWVTDFYSGDDVDVQAVLPEDEVK